MDSIRQALVRAVQLAEKLMKSDETGKFIAELSSLIADRFHNDGKVLICGNGGSAADAMHFAEEFTGRYRNDRKALPVLALADPTHITCVGNDYGFSQIFARGVEAWGRAGDILIILSTSGNSENVIQALKTAEQLKLKTVTLLGKDGGVLKDMANLQIIVPGDTTDRIQELHMLILHIVIEQVERLMFPENYQESL
ncbi:MAG: D-sedoheptulose 7-phosphate isomerase [Candidatus Cloacimonetes bacterium]|nr:D-sedoheptulose 7-phosphate isomerase [Candidatus Cloacimonadota bacterium]